MWMQMRVGGEETYVSRLGATSNNMMSGSGRRVFVVVADRGRDEVRVVRKRGVANGGGSGLDGDVSGGLRSHRLSIGDLSDRSHNRGLSFTTPPRPRSDVRAIRTPEAAGLVDNGQCQTIIVKSDKSKDRCCAWRYSQVMCIAIVSTAHPKYPFILLSNRDVRHVPPIPPPPSSPNP